MTSSRPGVDVTRASFEGPGEETLIKAETAGLEFSADSCFDVKFGSFFVRKYELVNLELFKCNCARSLSNTETKDVRSKYGELKHGTMPMKNRSLCSCTF